MRRAGLDPDPWQAAVLQTCAQRLLLLCTRQSGKSTVTAALTVVTILLEAPSLVLLLSPSLRQSGELFRKVKDFYHAAGRPVRTVQETALQLELANGSRVVSLPGSEGTVRGYSGVNLLVIDEAAKVDDSLYYAVRPMLAVSGGRLACLSTPFGRRGWFHAEWEDPKADWERTRVPATLCPRISKEFLEDERRAMGDRWFRQEYGCSFEDVVDAVFSWEDIQAAASDDVTPLFSGPDSPLDVKPLFSFGEE